MSSIAFGVRGGAVLLNDEMFLVQGQTIAANTLVTNAVIPLCAAGTNAYVVVVQIILRTKTAITGATVVPTVTAGWIAAGNTLVTTAVAIPVAASAQTLLNPAVGAVMGTAGTTLNLKVANTSAVGSAVGSLYVDVVGYLVP